MDADNQIVVPPSFIALFQDGRGRLQELPATVRERYELCEDMASSLTERALQVIHDHPSEAGVLQAFHAALNQPATGLRQVEARWVVLRLAELLNWASPPLQAAEITRP
ncbi:MAG: hypothetical protein BGO13_09975 [Burkholderiales bacterium 66-5]|nr:MAG: hypothetical protein BGO13_09975 [Burkholderiales bacterium 66-5]